jgi:hypothetical protein
MLGFLDSQSTPRRRISVAALGVAVLAAAFGAWLAVTHPRPEASPTTQAAEDQATPRPTATSDLDTHQAPLQQVAATADPQAFAESVAQRLFAWDTAAPFPLSDYTGQLLAVADPTGQESPGLMADIAGYLPTAEAWAFLKTYYTRQWLEISSVEVPDLWEQALTEAGQSLAPGTTAYTIRGSRHRGGIWEGEPVTSEYEVAFTVFIVCEPSYPTCHLLRLSRLDKPLD